MKLERLEDLKKITKRRTIIEQTIDNLEDKNYYSKTGLEVSLAIALLVYFGNSELHEKMFAEKVDMVTFIEEAYYLIEELKENAEYKAIYEDMFDEIKEMATEKAKYNSSITAQLVKFIQGLDLEKMNEIVDNLNLNTADKTEESTEKIDTAKSE